MHIFLEGLETISEAYVLFFSDSIHSLLVLLYFCELLFSRFHVPVFLASEKCIGLMWF